MECDDAMLASLLRESATIIERNEVSPILYKALEALHSYTERGGKPINANNGGGGAVTNKHHASNGNAGPTAGGAAAGGVPSAPPAPNPAKPAFQRPTKSSSNLVANGWIEQQRKSKMRVAFKEILASLVEGRRAGEETTLWIQRQVHNVQKNSQDLEALHQIPMKWIEEVNYVDFYGDFRFTVKVYNVADDFVFRTADEDSCKQWMATLISARDASLGNNRHKKPSPTTSPAASSGGTQQPAAAAAQQQPAPSSTRIPEPKQPRQSATNAGIRVNTGRNGTEQPSHPVKPAPSKRMSIKELKAIAHGAGYDTHGMERADLEKIAAHFAPASSKFPTPSVNKNNTAANGGKSSSNIPASNMKSTSQSNYAATAAAEAKRKEEMQKRMNEMNMKDKAKAEAEKKRREAEAERKRKEDEARREKQRWEEQWTKQNTPAPSPAATAPTSQPQQAQPNMFDSQRFYGQSQQQQNNVGGGARVPSRTQQPPNAAPTQPPPPPPPPPPPDPTSPINHKYAKAMASQAQANNNSNKEQDEQAKITAVKRNILMHWALIPPNYNSLKSIDQLLITIHKVFPPAFNVASHTYFAKWKQVNPQDLVLSAAMGNSPDEEKVKKAVRKLRFFLHPDRLPRDLNAEQTFMCKMLWDVSNDAWEEFMKQKDDLDWVHK